MYAFPIFSGVVQVAAMALVRWRTTIIHGYWFMTLRWTTHQKLDLFLSPIPSSASVSTAHDNKNHLS